MSQLHYRPLIFWFTGLPGSGKSTLAQALQKDLNARQLPSVILDGDLIRHGLSEDLGFSAKDRLENNRRCAHVAKILAEQGHQICICAIISPTEAIRTLLRTITGACYREIHVHCSLETCIKRDPKGHYARALKGEISHFTGLDDPFEEPKNAHLIVDTEHCSLEESLDKLLPWVHREIGV